MEEAGVGEDNTNPLFLPAGGAKYSPRVTPAA